MEDARYVTKSPIGRKFIAQALWKSHWVIKRQKYSHTSHWKATLQELERIMKSDLYSDIVDENEKRWMEDVTE